MARRKPLSRKELNDLKKSGEWMHPHSVDGITTRTAGVGELDKVEKGITPSGKIINAHSAYTDGLINYEEMVEAKKKYLKMMVGLSRRNK